MRSEDYLKKLTSYQIKMANLQCGLERITQARQIIEAYQQQQLPQRVKTKLLFSEEELFNHPELMALEDELLNLRQVVIEDFGIWHIFSQEWVADLKEYVGPGLGLELMAGNGVLSASIPGLIATDNLDWAGQDNESPQAWQRVEQLDAISALERYGLKANYIILAWAPDTSQIDWEILNWLRTKHWSGKFIVIGERNGATNSSKFWQEANLLKPRLLNQHHQAIDFINDEVFLVK